MSRRGFWLGLLVGVVITVLLAAVVMFAMRARWPAVGVYGLRGRGFGVMPRGWFYPRIPGRWFGFGTMLCGPLLLLAGAVVLGLLLGRHWRSRRQSQEMQSGEESSSAQKSTEAQHEPPAEAGPAETKS